MTSLKVLNVVSGGIKNGAGRGAYWLHQGLRNAGIASRIITNTADPSNDPDVVTVVNGKKQRIRMLLRNQFEQAPVRFYKKRKKSIFSTAIAGKDISRHPLYQWASIIHLHWINEAFINTKHLKKLKKPIVWTMRDMWPFTGGCHISDDCHKYQESCGACPHLGSKCAYDLSYYVLKRKKIHYPCMVMVGISNWLTDLARQSTVLRGFDVRTIYNNVDTKTFSPLDKQVAKEILGFNTSKKIILLGAAKVEIYYKGFDKYIEALRLLDPATHYLAFFGKLNDEKLRALGFEYKSTGYLHDDISMRLMYAAADVFVNPSLMDAFGKTTVEAMACGTPVVCFNATGPAEIVDHMVNGYKATPYDSNDLSNGIRWVLSHSNYSAVAANAREKAENTFSTSRIAEQYIDLYKELL